MAELPTDAERGAWHQKNLKFQLDGYFRSYWHDWRLRFSETSCRDVIILQDEFVTSSYRLWTPGEQPPCPRRPVAAPAFGPIPCGAFGSGRS